jgi:uncharacterized protein (UPF0332 family)
MNDMLRKDIINHRLQKSKETVDEAKLALENNYLRLALNRNYYSIFYAVSALALKNDFSTSKHKQLLGWFGFNFVRTDKITQNLFSIYKNAFDNRQESDYLDFVQYDKSQIENYFNDMLVFVEEIEKLINEVE